MWMRATALTVLVLAACSSSTKAPAPTPDAGMPTCTQATPCPLTLGMPTTGLIAAKGQANNYTITVSADHAGKRPIIQVQLSRTAPVSALKPVFALTSPDGQTVIGTRGPPAEPGPAQLAANLLVPEPGTYGLIVRDADGTTFDARNPYTLTANVFDDPDTAEPDDTPAMARPLTPGTPAQGWIASAGDRDLLSFQMAAQGLMELKLDEGATGGALRLHARLLLLGAQNDLGTATVVAEFLAPHGTEALHVDVVRLLQQGSYLVELTDDSGQEADERAAAQWSFAITPTAEPDMQDQGATRNDTPQTATVIPPTGTTMLEGVIGSQGDRDWYQVALPSSTAANIVEVRIDPMQANSEVQLLWAVGEQLAMPTGACDTSCGPTLFCSGMKCAYQPHAFIDYGANDTTKQMVRIRQQGDAKSILIVVSDQGDMRRTLKPYGIQVSVFPDPDPNEPEVSNDSIPNATPLSYAVDADGGVTYQSSGMISWWDFVNGRGTFQEPEDTDWYELPMPPRTPAPCPLGDPDDDGGFPDGGNDDFLPDGGSSAGVTLDDGGPYDELTPVCPVAADGGMVYLPRPDYGLTMHWHGPMMDGAYQLGLQGVASVDGTKNACLFSFDQRYAHPDGMGGYVLGNDPKDPCFCLPAAQAEQDKIWVRIDAPHRPIPPMANAYSDLAYSFDLQLTPGALQPACKGQCKPLTQASSCP